MRDVLTTLLELVGVAAVIAGVALWSRPAALVVAGTVIAAVGWGLSVPRGGAGR